MLKILRQITIILFFAAMFCGQIVAQNAVNSPYSRLGIGVVNYTAPTSLSALGGTAYAMQHPYFVNFRNPASYVAFDSLSFIADAAFSVVFNTLKTTDLSQRSTYARFDYLAIGLPLTKHWRTSAGIIPFSDMGYITKQQNEITNIGPSTYTYSGDGGLMQLYWGNAFKICKGLSLGLNASYIFGRLTSIRTVEISGKNFFNTTIDNSTQIDGIYLSGGLQYFGTVKDKHKLGVGVVYENSAYIWARENEFITIFEGAANNITGKDTLLNVAGRRGSLKLPQSVGGGISYNYNDHLLVGVDVTWQNWQQYRLMGEADVLKDALISSIGIQYTPDPTSPKYIKRVNIRAGARYSSGYLTFRDAAVPEMTFTLGFGFPLKGFNSHSSVNVMFEYGKIGNLKQNIISEDYYKLSFNFILQEKWYQRVKLE